MFWAVISAVLYSPDSGWPFVQVTGKHQPTNTALSSRMRDLIVAELKGSSVSVTVPHCPCDCLLAVGVSLLAAMSQAPSYCQGCGGRQAGHDFSSVCTGCRQLLQMTSSPLLFAASCLSLSVLLHKAQPVWLPHFSQPPARCNLN